MDLLFTKQLEIILVFVEWYGSISKLSFAGKKNIGRTSKFSSNLYQMLLRKLQLVVLGD